MRQHTRSSVAAVAAARSKCGFSLNRFPIYMFLRRARTKYMDSSFLIRQSRRITALVLLSCLYLLARLPQLPETERQSLAAKFRFSRLALPDPPGPLKSIRAVNPSLRGIAGWISSVGAGIALNDL